jgi:hypothetical protein
MQTCAVIAIDSGAMIILLAWASAAIVGLILSLLVLIAILRR